LIHSCFSSRPHFDFVTVIVVVAEPQLGLEEKLTEPSCFFTLMLKLAVPLVVRVRVAGVT
jgi:hypothetical protein